MRAPRRKRPAVREFFVPAGTQLAAVAERVDYVGSPEHKTGPSFAGQPRPRADATICDASFANRREEIRGRLRTAVEHGFVGGVWEGGFPRYVWCRIGDTVYEARLVNSGNGEYKGYELLRDQWPRNIEEVHE